MPTHAQRLIHAVRTRNYEQLVALVRSCGDLAARSVAGRTALHAAAEEGDREAARILIEAGADVSARMHNGLTPLHLAAACGGYCDLADPDPDRRSPCGLNRRRPVSLEVAKVITDIIKDKHPHIPSQLGPQDAIPEQDKAEDFLAVFECIADPAQLHREIVARGIDVDRVDPDFSEHLRGNPRFLAVVELLLAHKADVCAVDDYDASVLQHAVELGRPEIVELLLKHGAEPNRRTTANSRPEPLFELALERSKIEVAEILLRHGAEFNPDEPGLLHAAAANGRQKVLLWLLEHGADVNRQDDDGNTPLLVAARCGHAAAVAALIVLGADVQKRDRQGDGLLHAAAPYPSCLERVLQLSLPLDEPNVRGQTALHVAATFGDAAPVIALLQAGASLNVPDRQGNTPLHAVFFGDECRPDMEFPVFQALVSAGADRAIKNHDGSTAFDLATLNGYPEECLKLLDPGGASNPGNGPVA